MRNNSYRNNTMTKKNSLLQPRSISRTLLSLLPDIAANWMMTTIIVVVFMTFPTVIMYTDAAAADDYGTPYNYPSCPPYEAAVLGDEYAAETDRFCGTDGQRHVQNCRNFFAYGQEIYTGISTTTNDDDNATTSPAPLELICSSYVYNGDEGVFYANRDNGVYYGCRSPDYDHDPNYGVYMSFNEQCSAQINERTTFDCWQYKEGTNFDSFLSEASNANLTLCNTTKDEDDDSSYPVAFSYSTSGFFPSEYVTITTGFTIIRHSITDFNENMAKTTMHWLLTVEAPTAAPSVSEQPSSSTSTPIRYHIGSSSHNNHMVVGNNMSTILLILAMKISYSLFIY